MRKIRRSVALRRFITVLLCWTMLFYTIACNFYKVSYYSPEEVVQNSGIQGQKVMFLHNAADIFLIKWVTWKAGEEGRTMSMELSQLNSSSAVFTGKVYYHTGRQKQYRPSVEGSIIREAHFYLSSPIVGLSPGVQDIPVAALKEVHVIDRDAAKSTVSTVVLITGISAVVGTAIIYIAAMAALSSAFNSIPSSSCPYIYTYDGEQFVFEGEIFSGAVLSNLERHDYLELTKLTPEKGRYRIAIANELQEQQFINLAEIQVVHHPLGAQVAYDAQGTLQLISAPQLPAAATSALGQNVDALIAQKDQQAYLFDEEQAPLNQLVLRFHNKQNGGQPKLVLRAKNALWFDMLYQQYTEKWGTAYPLWIAQQEAMGAVATMNKINEQDFLLSAYLKDAHGRWQLAGRLPLAGPMGWRDMVLPLNPALLHGETVEMKIETGYRFWELDYAAIDFSDNAGMEVVTLHPQYAKDQDGKSQLQTLANDDEQYLKQLQTGNSTEIRFRAITPPEGRAQSLFLHTKGYYLHVRNYQGEPQLGELLHFDQPHYFDQFSRNEFRRFFTSFRLESDALISE
jgi:hypothetical protein